MSPERLFGTDGIRGTAGEGPLAPERVLALGRALARALRPPARRAVLCRDTRRSGPMVRDALAAGLLAEGVDVIDAGVRPTPALPYLARAWGCDFGVVLSASHNPMPDNGIKVFGADGAKLSDELEDRVEREEARPVAAKTGKAIGRALPVPGGEDPYRSALLAEGKRFGGLTGRRLVVDCAHGAAWRDAPELLLALGAEIVALGASPDGDNINEGCGALQPENMARATAREGAFAGLALDGDGDRLILADETGAVRDGDFMLAGLARRLRVRGGLPGDTVAGTVMSNVGLEVCLGEIGARLHRAPVGDRGVAEAMRENGWAIGGEPSGHVIFRGPSGLLPGDGLLTALRVLEAALEAGALSALVPGWRSFPQVLVNVRVARKVPFEEIPGLCERKAAIEKALAGRGRVVLRYSGTESKARVMVEGPEEGQVRAFAEELADLLRLTSGK